MSQEAKRDAGEITARDRIEIAWAVPLSPRSSRGRGRYWAFFPTTYESSLTGILNAPWKTNSDRQSLLEGPYNREIIEAGAGLVAERLAELDNSEDHGAHLDLLPARLSAISRYERLALPSGSVPAYYVCRISTQCVLYCSSWRYCSSPAQAAMTP